MRKLVIATVLFLGIAVSSFGQTYTLSTSLGTQTTCSGTFVDGGGSGGNYSNSTNYTVTFCSGSTAHVVVSFSSFNVESGYDHLLIYDGSSTASTLVDDVTGNVGAFVVQSSGSCITFNFTSDISNVLAGWVATISCTVPCITPTAGGVITNQTSPVMVCRNEVINFSGASSTAGGGFSISSYLWNFDDGTTGTGVTTSHSYSAPGQYIVNLDVTDNNGCHNTNRIDLVIQVGTAPKFTGTTANQTVCAGQNVCLNGVVTPTAWQDIPSTVVAGTTPLPDGTGVCYNSPLTFTDFAAGQTITSGSQVQNIYASIEHTFAGDLTITIICPNGQQAGLFNSDGTFCTTNISSEDFGNQSVTPPTGYLYTWTSTGTTMDAWDALNASATVIPSGTYGSEQPYTNLVGCPLNGTWTLKICDTHSIDDGTVFSWGLNFDPSVYSSLPGFTPTFNANCAGTYWGGVNPASTSAITSTSANCDQICVTPPAAGTYSYIYTGIDNFGCTFDTTITVTATAGPTVTVNSPTICNGTSATLTANGAVSYSWTGGLGTGNPKTVSPTSNIVYTVTGTSAAGCAGTANATVTVNPLPTATLSGTTTICSGASTNLQVALTGTAPWSFTYNDGTSHTVTLNSNPATISVNPTVTTTYTTVSVSDANCTGTVSGSAIVTVNPAIVISNVNTTCNGPNTQYQVTFNIAGGNPATYSVTPAGTITPGTPYTYTSNWINSGTGYSFSVTDTYNCIPQVTSGTFSCSCPAAGTLSGNATICAGSSTNLNFALTGTAPWSIIYSDGTSSYTVNNINTSPRTISVSPSNTTTYTLTSVSDASCTGTATGTAVITVNQIPVVSATPASQAFCTGGTTGISLSSTVTGTNFAWTASASGSITGFSNSSGNTILQTLVNSGTTPGTVTYVITPTANSCVGLPINVVITVNPNPTANAGTDQIICVGQCANLTAFGGSSYLWSNSALTPNTNVCPLITTAYNVTVTDANNCKGTDNVQVTVNPLPTANAGVDQSICNGNPTNLNASGGTVYAWNPAAGLTSTSIFNPSANPVSTTTYSVIVTDNNGCSAADQMILTVNPLPVANAGSDQTICAGIPASLLATGGSSYIWSPAGTLINSSSANPTANPSANTIYAVTVTDGNNCSATDDMTVNVNPVPTSVFSVTSPVCVGANSLISYTGGAGVGASYSWSFAGGTIISGSGKGPYQITWSTPGTHNVSLSVTENNCTSTVSTLPVLVDKVVASLAITDSVSCYGLSDGAVTVSQAGILPLTYIWDPAPSGAAGQVALGLSANILYSVTVTDSYGCKDIKTITLSEPLPLAMTFSTQNAICFGNHNGTANAFITGGTMPYTYTWSAPAPAGNVSSASNLAAGGHSLTVIDKKGCSIDTSYVISQPPLLTYSYITQNVTCNGGQDGSININPSGGTYPLGFTWSPAIPGDSIVTSLASNTYNLTITDHSGCDTTLSVFISQPTPIVLTISSNDTICYGQSTTISASATGGNGSPIFAWDNGLGQGPSFPVSPLTTTTYTVNVSDISGCSTAPKSVTIFVNPVLSATLNGSPLSICNGDSTSLIAQANGGNGNYTYTWDHGIGIAGNQVTVSPATTTTYVVVVSDNCNTPVATDDITITVYPVPTVTFTADPLSGCIPLSVTFSDNTTPAIQSWNWDFGDPVSGPQNVSQDSNPTHVFYESGTFSVSLNVMTTEGCKGSFIHNDMIEVYPKPEAAFNTFPGMGSYDNPSILFIDLSSNAATWNWNFGDSLSTSNVSIEPNPQHQFSNSGTYTVWLVVESPFGCIDSTSKDVYIKADFGIFFPNAFTPNGDGDNDGFGPKGYGIDPNNYELYIFDRWGEEIFHTNDLNEFWKGKVKNSSGYAQIAVYSWVCVVKDVNGETYNLNGRVTLVR